MVGLGCQTSGCHHLETWTSQMKIKRVTRDEEQSRGTYQPLTYRRQIQTGTRPLLSLFKFTAAYYDTSHLKTTKCSYPQEFGILQ